MLLSPVPVVRAESSCSKIFDFNIDSILDGLNPFAVYNNKILGLSHLRLAPPSFFTYEGKGSIVGINAVSELEMYRGAADYMTGSTQVQPGKVFQSRVSSPEEFVSRLYGIYHQSGPINKLVIAAHGESGSMSFGSKRLNAAWVEENKFRFDNLPQDLFTADATIVLISCNTASGFFFDPNYGVRRLKKIFAPLLKQGGKIIASTRYVDPRLSKIPEEYKSFEQRAARHMLILPLGSLWDSVEWLLYDWRSKFKKRIVIQIDPRET